MTVLTTFTSPKFIQLLDQLAQLIEKNEQTDLDSGVANATPTEVQYEFETEIFDGTVEEA